MEYIHRFPYFANKPNIRLKTRETSRQNVGNSENIGQIVLGTVQ